MILQEPTHRSRILFVILVRLALGAADCDYRMYIPSGETGCKDWTYKTNNDCTEALWIPGTSTTDSLCLGTLALVPFFGDDDTDNENVVANFATDSDSTEKALDLFYKTGPDGSLKVTIYEEDCVTPEKQFETKLQINEASSGQKAAVFDNKQSANAGSEGVVVTDLENADARKWTVQVDLTTNRLPTSSLFTTLEDNNAEIKVCVRVDLEVDGFDEPIMFHKTIITISVTLNAAFNSFNKVCGNTALPCTTEDDCAEGDSCNFMSNKVCEDTDTPCTTEDDCAEDVPCNECTADTCSEGLSLTELGSTEFGAETEEIVSYEVTACMCEGVTSRVLNSDSDCAEVASVGTLTQNSWMEVCVSTDSRDVVIADNGLDITVSQSGITRATPIRTITYGDPEKKHLGIYRLMLTPNFFVDPVAVIVQGTVILEFLGSRRRVLANVVLQQVLEEFEQKTRFEEKQQRNLEEDAAVDFVVEVQLGVAEEVGSGEITDISASSLSNSSLVTRTRSSTSPTVCEEDFQVLGHSCIRCLDGFHAVAGADTSGPNTTCEQQQFPASNMILIGTGLFVLSACMLFGVKMIKERKAGSAKVLAVGSGTAVHISKTIQ